MRTKVLTLLAVALLAMPGLALAQIGQTGVITGTVTDSSGGVLPGVTITVTSPALIGGSRTAVTDATGVYRFPALTPGTYTVSMELQGFKEFRRDDVRLPLGQTVAIDGKLDVGALQETVNVSGESPVVDVKSSAAQKNLTSDLLESVPNSARFGPNAFYMASGVNPNNGTAYGSGGSSSNALMIDGVDVSDPEAGTAWVFANYNWIQEVQVVGLGAPAEYGGFTGVASNSLFRSGSNQVSGFFETLLMRDALVGRNVTDALLEENPDLTPGKTFYETDTTFQLGGPIKKDKLWYFASAQYYRPKTAAPGFPQPGWTSADGGPEARLEKSPRGLFKPTWQIGPNDKLTGFLEYDQYTVEGRRNAANVAPVATLHQDSPESTWNLNYTKVISSTTVLDVKYSGFWGYYYLNPYKGNDQPGWYDLDEDFYSKNSYYYYKADRLRHQANGSVSKYATGFAGSHNLKFGFEYERSYVKSEYGYPGGRLIYAYSGVPAYAIYYDGYLKDNINNRITGFVQDSWTMGKRFTFNPGVRIDHFTGYSQHLKKQVFSTTGIAPRVGFAWDLAGDGKTVIRGHYGHYFDGAKSTYYDLLDPQQSAFYYADIDSTTLRPLYTPYAISAGVNRTMDDSIKHPWMRQAIVGIERELFPGFSLGITGIYRRNQDFIDDVLVIEPGMFTTQAVRDPGEDSNGRNATSQVLTSYRLNSAFDPLEMQYLITNPKDAFRYYRGVEITATRRMSSRWTMQTSWVISKITGNYNNNSSAGNSSEFNDPNQDPNYQPLREGRLGRDNTHIAKVLSSVRGPWGIQLSGIYNFISGNRWQRTVRVSLPQGGKEMFIEERGTRKFDDQSILDLKAMKEFKFGATSRVALGAELFNVLNSGAIDNRTARSGSSFNRPLSLVSPRRARLSLTYRF